MSTRATYCFLANADHFEPKTTFYIHHDGYPEGAADYFRAMLGNGGTTCNNFMRANLRASITPNHATHADTEYRYDVSNSKGFAEVTCREGCGSSWKTVFKGSLGTFLATYEHN